MSVKIPKGFVRAPAGHVLREDYTDIICGAVGEPYKNSRVWVWVSGIAGQSCDSSGKHMDRICAIPAPAKADDRPVVYAPHMEHEPAPVEAVKCPACGCKMAKHLIRYSCTTADCELHNMLLSLDFIKRMTIAPKPLKCPVCGGEAVVVFYDGEWLGGCKNNKCAIAGPAAPTESEARDKFARLLYRKETPR